MDSSSATRTRLEDQVSKENVVAEFVIDRKLVKFAGFRCPGGCPGGSIWSAIPERRKMCVMNIDCSSTTCTRSSTRVFAVLVLISGCDQTS